VEQPKKLVTARIQDKQHSHFASPYEIISNAPHVTDPEHHRSPQLTHLWNMHIWQSKELIWTCWCQTNCVPDSGWPHALVASQVAPIDARPVAINTNTSIPSIELDCGTEVTSLYTPQSSTPRIEQDRATGSVTICYIEYTQYRTRQCHCTDM